MYVNGSDLLSCPILDHNGKTVGVLQVAVTDLIELEEISNMNVMVPKEFENISRQADLHANDALSSTSEENDSNSSAFEASAQNFSVIYFHVSENEFLPAETPLSD